MLLRETGFTFDGKHCRNDFGLIYAEKDGHTIVPRIRRNEYSIAGMSGSVLFDGEEWQTITFEGTLYPAKERATQAAAQPMLRRVARWLTAGRRPLIFDYEPKVYYMAQLSEASKWSLKNWFGGEISVRFEAQPFAYSVEPQTFSASESGDGDVSAAIDMKTNYLAGFTVTVSPTGTAGLTGAELALDGTVFASFSGLDLGCGEAMTVCMEPPIGATVADGVTMENALPHAGVFRPALIPRGASTLTVTPEYGSGTAGAVVVITARGRW